MGPNIKATRTGSSGNLKAALERIANSQVYVGIPQSAASRPGEPVNNAELMYLHTNGSALQHIPARPVIEPAIEEPTNKALISAALGKAAKDYLAGDPEAAHQDLEKAGMLGANAAKKWFVSPLNGWAPNTPYTIARKGSDRPLIDTGELRRSITSVVKGDED